MTSFDFRDEYLFNIHRNVEEHGFAIQYVLGDEHGPPWAYTIGFLPHGHPEVIVFGLDPESSAHALHSLFDEIVQGAFRPVGREREQALGDPPLPVGVLPVPDHHWDCSENRLCIAVEYYRSVGWKRSQMEARQLVWATPTGCFPWDAACEPRLRRLQPILDRRGLRAL